MTPAPGRGDGKFFEVRYDKVGGDSLFIDGKLYYDGSIDWQDVKGWEDDISKAHEIAVAEAVKEAVERCAKIVMDHSKECFCPPDISCSEFLENEIRKGMPGVL